MSVPPETQTPAEQILLRPASCWLERIVGAVALLFGSLLLLGTMFGAHGMLSKPATTFLASVFAILVLALVGVLLTVAGVRLVLGLPNRQGALFVPAVWFAISAAMLLTAVFFAMILVPEDAVEAGRGIASALLLALLSYGAGAHFRRNAEHRRAASQETPSK